MKTTEEHLKIISDKLQLLVKKFAAMKKEGISLTTELDQTKLREKELLEKCSILERAVELLKPVKHSLSSLSFASLGTKRVSPNPARRNILPQTPFTK